MAGRGGAGRGWAGLGWAKLGEAGRGEGEGWMDGWMIESDEVNIHFSQLFKSVLNSL